MAPSPVMPPRLITCAVAIATGVAIAVTFSEPAFVVRPPRNARVEPFTAADGIRIVMLTTPPEPPPASAVAWSFEVAEIVTAPLPTIAPPMPASVEAAASITAEATASETAISPAEKIAASASALFAETAVAVAPVPLVTPPR